MTARYLLTLPDFSASILEGQLGGLIEIDAGDVLVPVAGLDAITNEEYEFISRRLSTSGPVYHAGGPS